MSVFLLNEIELALNDSKEILKNFISSDFFLSRDKTKILVKSNLQSFSILKNKNKLLNSILEIIISNALEAEKISPGGFEKTINLWLKEETSKEVNAFSPTFEDLSKIIEEYCKNTQLKSIVLDAIVLAGFRGVVSIEKSSNSNISIELIEDYQFDCSSFEKQIRLIKPKMLCIDGYVASVSELNLLFESLVGNGSQLVIIAKGFDEEVISTIKVNNARNIFNVHPVIVPFVLENINTIGDIATVVGTTPVSSHLGQVIANVDISNAIQVDEVKLTNQKIFIKNKKTKSNVALHVTNLFEKLKTKENTKELYEKRIKSLTCNNVVIRLPDDKNFVENSQSIDFSLRAVRSLLSFGITDEKKLAATQLSGKIFSEKIDNLISNLGSVIFH